MTRIIKKKITAIAVSMALAAPMIALDAGKAVAGPDPFIGELMLVGGTYCPAKWARADGQELSIASHSALFALFGTNYGGDGRSTFALPDLRGRVPIHNGTGPGLQPVQIGERMGRENVTLTVNQMPAHSHDVIATDADANKSGPGGDLLAKKVGQPIYHDANTGDTLKTMDPRMIAPKGGGQAIDIRNPGLGMMWCVALDGAFPPRS